MRHLVLAFLIVAAGHAQAAAQTAAPSPVPSTSPAPAPSATPLAWHTYVTPYIWVPNINGDLNFTRPAFAPAAPGNVNIAVHVGPSSYLSNVNFAAMVSAYARRGDLSLGADYLYLNMSSKSATVTSVTDPNGNVVTPINVGTNSHVRGTIATLDAGLRITQSEISPMEFLGGVRYLGTSMSADWQFTGALPNLPASGSVSKNVYTWDPIVGLRGAVGLGKKWYLPYYLDYGAGSDNVTDQEFVGIGFSQGWGDIVLINRWLHYTFVNNTAIQLVGPAIGARIRL